MIVNINNVIRKTVSNYLEESVFHFYLLVLKVKRNLHEELACFEFEQQNYQ